MFAVGLANLLGRTGAWGGKGMWNQTTAWFCFPPENSEQSLGTACFAAMVSVQKPRQLEGLNGCAVSNEKSP